MRLAAALFLVLLAGPVLAQSRIVVPISQTFLPDGDIRYSVPIRVGNSQPVAALLDTGSTGLRVLPGAVPADTYTDTGFSALYAYGSGDALSGTIATAPLTIGEAVTDSAVLLEAVSSVGCVIGTPHCGAGKLALQDYGIGGDGMAGQGFAAILGISLIPATGAGYTDNPLMHIGAKRWIIELPEPGSTAPGALILNPDDAELRNYQLFHLAALPGGAAGQDSGWLDSVPVCLRNLSTTESICGPAILDTGTPGIIAYTNGGAAGPLWSPGDNLALDFSTAGSGVLTTSFAADRYPGSGVLRQPQAGGTALVAGILPFFAYSVLYDAGNGMIGLKPREDVPDFTAAQAMAAAVEDPDQQIEVIKLNAPGAAAPAAPGEMQLPQVITPGP
jgi:hypothetical protein